MIPRANVTAWRRVAPWPSDAQVEQDLVLSRVLVELFSRPSLAERVAFRGGTALHKLYFAPPARYSEDIDLVQRERGPIGPVADEIRDTLAPWLGTPSTRAGRDVFTLVFRFTTSSTPAVTMRVKIEINTREHRAVEGFVTLPFEVESPWFAGSADVVTFGLCELLGTKLRALFQRKKGRDLFDLALGVDHPEFDAERVVDVFGRYTAGVALITRARFEENMAGKLRDPNFAADVRALLGTGVGHEPARAWERVSAHLVSRLPERPGGSVSGGA